MLQKMTEMANTEMGRDNDSGGLWLQSQFQSLAFSVCLKTIDMDSPEIAQMIKNQNKVVLADDSSKNQWRYQIHFGDVG